MRDLLEMTERLIQRGKSLSILPLFLFFILLCVFVNLRIKAENLEDVKVLKADLEWRYCPSDKPIKGNINQFKNTKIYHLPASAVYKRTNPEACFTNTQEAEEAGFRESLR